MTEHDTADADRASELAHAVARSLDGRTVATAESCTAGRVMAAFATVAHAAEFFRGGLVAYQESVKRDVLGVEAVSVYSPRAVEQMARGVAALVGADAAVATSGVVGDAPVDGTDPGTTTSARWSTATCGRYSAWWPVTLPRCAPTPCASRSTRCVRTFVPASAHPADGSCQDVCSTAATTG